MVIKKFNRLESAQKFMHVGIDVKCMHTNFGGRSLSSFGDIATFKNGQISLLTMDYSPWSLKNLIDRNWPKNSCKYGLMSSACTPILVGMAYPVSEILLLSKTVKFPFLTMDYSPWSSKNLIDRNWPKKFMKVGIDVKCMHTNFGGHGLSGFRDIATFKNSQFSLSDHGL